LAIETFPDNSPQAEYPKHDPSPISMASVKMVKGLKVQSDMLHETQVGILNIYGRTGRRVDTRVASEAAIRSHRERSSHGIICIRLGT
jgi:hypothetical protein